MSVCLNFIWDINSYAQVQQTRCHGSKLVPKTIPNKQIHPQPTPNYPPKMTNNTFCTFFSCLSNDLKRSICMMQKYMDHCQKHHFQPQQIPTPSMLPHMQKKSAPRGGGGGSDLLEQQYTCEQMIEYFKNMETKIINGLKINIGYQKWHWTFFKYYKVWNNRSFGIISNASSFFY